MNSRDMILSRLREVSPVPRRLPEVPMFDSALPPEVKSFRKSLDRLGGVWCLLPEDISLDQFVRSRFRDATVFCSATPEFTATRDIALVDDPRALDDVDVGIVRPAFAVAETGSIWLSEAQYNVNALGYLSQHLIALLDPADIVGNLHQAYHRDEPQEIARCAPLRFSFQQYPQAGYCDSPIRCCSWEMKSAAMRLYAAGRTSWISPD
ncbi:hypothetical protein F6X37_34225 [Paraburkholderia sp. 31.1]|uniref:LutC/YkgG family protein n=1 Tax=Paraburkholderia sp. 31.1 TaxID=2615205 RepID=UPI0016560431|nr:LUD domain-containing protein [Paraburkholderia sp. 31.1]MBC8726402.1 hypothetical protein [Paraburkholderia sp. 31.1]